MDHSNLVKGQKCSHEQCPHGRCLNHDPEWENIGKQRRVPNPGIFGKKTFWTSYCCEKAMARYKEVETKRCKKCGRTEDFVVTELVAHCLCCGYHFDNTSYGCDS